MKCKTAKNSPNPNQNCIFPFRVEGKQFTECSDVQTSFGFLKNICATKTNGITNEMLPFQFGVCSQDCKNTANGEWNWIHHYLKFLQDVLDQIFQILWIFVSLQKFSWNWIVTFYCKCHLENWDFTMQIWFPEITFKNNV